MRKGDGRIFFQDSMGHGFCLESVRKLRFY
jgi:hypothetical protein